MPKHTTLFASLIALIALFSPAASAAPYDDLQGEITYSGTLWEKARNDIEGHWYVDELENGDRYLRLSEDFKTRKAPDLKLVLSTRASDTLSKRNVLSGGTVLGALSSHEGAQSFVIPAGVDLSDILSIAIHCEEYNVFWGAAPFNPGRVLYASDDWTKKSNSVKGSYEIAEIDGNHVLRTSASFSTSKAPDLKFVFSNHTSRQAKSRNALSGGVVIAKLSSHKGAQEYELDDTIDPADYSTLLIHCEQYTKLWAAAPLTASE